MTDKKMQEASTHLALAAELIREALRERECELDEMPERGFYDRRKELNDDIEVLEQIDLDELDFMVKVLA